MFAQSGVRAVLFDLDDTLSDHQFSRRCGLETLRQKYPLLQKVKIEILENEHEKLLQSNYQQILDRHLSMDEAIAERIRQLCRIYHVALTAQEAWVAMGEYEAAYSSNRRAVPGALQLLRHLSQHVTVGVVTNGLEDIQRTKVRELGLEPYISFLLVSETLGIRKPAPGIFLEALRLAGVQPEQAVFIGDSWNSDILGAFRCGIRTIWLNRYNLSAPDPAIAVEINVFEPIENVLRHVLTA